MSEALLDRVLDRSILWSFDRSGYQRHQAAFRPEDLERSMKGKTCLVTGANSGLGLAIARGLAARQATVHLLCQREVEPRLPTSFRTRRTGTSTSS